MSAASPDCTWHIITCEYPPTVGGVSDYSRTLATALSTTARTHVWAPGAAGVADEGGVAVHRTLGGFTPDDLTRAGQALDQLPGPKRLLVQWVPHGFGFRAMNVRFAWWLLMRATRHGDDLQVMVHEPFVMFAARPGQFVMACVHRLMFTTACAAASHVWTSTPSWFARVTPYLLGRLTPRWLPVPAPPLDIRRADSIGPETHAATAPVVGHFGTHAPLVTALLGPALDVVLAETQAHVVLIGRDSDRFLAEFLRTRPGAVARVRATGVAEPAALAQQIAGCDLMLQPYPDGVSARRTSTLGLMKNGCAVVTNEGHLSEPFWREEGGLELVDRPDAAELGAAAVRLIADSARRQALAERASAVYDRTFDIRHSVRLLTTGQAREQVEAVRA